MRCNRLSIFSLVHSIFFHPMRLEDTCALIALVGRALKALSWRRLDDRTLKGGPLMFLVGQFFAVQFTGMISLLTSLKPSLSRAFFPFDPLGLLLSLRAENIQSETSNSMSFGRKMSNRHLLWNSATKPVLEPRSTESFMSAPVARWKRLPTQLRGPKAGWINVTRRLLFQYYGPGNIPIPMLSDGTSPPHPSSTFDEMSSSCGLNSDRTVETLRSVRRSRRFSGTELLSPSLLPARRPSARE